MEGQTIDPLSCLIRVKVYVSFRQGYVLQLGYEAEVLVASIIQLKVVDWKAEFTYLA